jgi:Cu+-exporting ATPase
MTVTEQSPHHLQHAGVVVYFCCAGCLAKFAADRSKYSTPPTKQPPLPPTDPHSPAADGTIYTCPMHPQVRQNHPGACPICGMTLESEVPSVDEGENPELLDFRRRLLWTLPLTVSVTALAMTGHRLHAFDAAAQNWIELVLPARGAVGRDAIFRTGNAIGAAA